MADAAKIKNVIMDDTYTGHYRQMETEKYNVTKDNIILYYNFHIRERKRRSMALAKKTIYKTQTIFIVEII